MHFRRGISVEAWLNSPVESLCTNNRAIAAKRFPGKVFFLVEVDLDELNVLKTALQHLHPDILEHNPTTVGIASKLFEDIKEIQ